MVQSVEPSTAPSSTQSQQCIHECSRAARCAAARARRIFYFHCHHPNGRGPRAKFYFCGQRAPLFCSMPEIGQKAGGHDQRHLADSSAACSSSSCARNATTDADTFASAGWCRGWSPAESASAGTTTGNNTVGVSISGKSACAGTGK